MITEEQIKQFENKIDEDKLTAFKHLLNTYREQRNTVRNLQNDVDSYKKSLEKYATDAHYRVDWTTLEVRPFKRIGECKKCNAKNVGLVNYNSNIPEGWWVCERCDRVLDNEFEDEYK
jgi:hypothetical protein